MIIQKPPVTMGTSPIRPLNQKGAGERFGNAGWMLRTFDLMKIGNATLPHSQLIYGTMIASRIPMARTNNERWEVLRRDPMGWYVWFMGKPWFEGAIMHMLTFKDPELKGMVFSKLPFKSEGLWSRLDPIRQFMPTSVEQLAQRERQAMVAMKRLKSSNAVVQHTANLFEKARTVLRLTSFVSLVSTVLVMGIAINYINIFFTRRNVERAKRAQFNPVPRPPAPFASAQPGAAVAPSAFAQRLPSATP